MPIVEWDNSFLLGISEFDEHHQHLVGLLNKSYDAFVTDQPLQEFSTVFDELLEYTIYHFSAEEFWMKENSYPKYDEHAEEHSKFAAEVVRLRKEFGSGKTEVTLDVMCFLRNWLVDHILKTDADYGIYMATLGVPKNAA